MGKNFENIFVFFLFAGLGMIFCYPIFSSKTIIGYGDVFFYLWDIWWVKDAFLNGLNPYFTNLILYPIGWDLSFNTMSLFSGLISIPLQFLFELPVAYNILVYISFPLSALGMFFLLRYLLNDINISIIGGLIYGFCPYHIAHTLGHLSLLSIQYIPFFILFFFKALKEGGRINCILAGIFYTINFYTDMTYTFFITLFSVFLFIYCFFVENLIPKKRVIFNTLSVFVLGTLLSSPLIFSMLYSFFFNPDDTLNHGGYSEYSADIMAYLIPSPFNPIFNGFINNIYTNIFTGNLAENVVFLGFVPMILSIIGIIHIRKEKQIGFWMIITIIFMVLSLGPYLHFFGLVSNPFGLYISNIPLPFIIFQDFPLISFMRAPSRFSIMAVIGVCVLSGYGLIYIKEYINRRLSKRGLTFNFISISIFLLILIEFLVFPVFWVSDSSLSPIYYELSLKSNMENNSGVLELPTSNTLNWAFPISMYAQTIHKKPLATGYGKVPKKWVEFSKRTPIINDLMIYYEGDIPSNQNYLKLNKSAISNDILSYFGYEYIIIHANLLRDRQLKYLNNYLNKTIKGSIIYRDDNDILYHIDKPNKDSYNKTKIWVEKYLLNNYYDIGTEISGHSYGNLVNYLGNGWSYQENEFIWTDSDKATLLFKIENPPDSLILNLDAATLRNAGNHPQHLRITINEFVSNDYIVIDGYFKKYSIQLPYRSLKNGENVISFDLPDAVSPKELKINDDVRKLGIAVKSLSIESLVY